MEGRLMARIVFDLDGTLIDSAPDLHRVANALLAEEGAAPVTLEDARGFIGHGAPTFIKRMRAARNLPDSAHDRLLAEFVRRYDAAVELTVTYPGAVEAIDALAAEGHAIGLCTNKPYRPCISVLDHLGLTARFAAITGGDSMPERKPDPAPLHATFAALGAEGPMLYIGDSEVDAECADRAGAPFLLYTEGYRKAPVEDLPHAAAFSDFAALPALAREILGEA
jgi:phosphoglycolate phosphatase